MPIEDQLQIENQIQRFCSYFSRQLIVIRALTLNNNQLEGTGPADHKIRSYQKILIVTALDALAGIRFPKDTYPELHMKNRKRFIRFISEYSSWDNGVLISIPFLYDRLCEIDAKDENLAKFLREKLDRYNPQDGIVYPSDKIDQHPDLLLPLANSKKEKKAIWSNQHYSLLYGYRNFLVHGSREPGHAMEGIRNGEDSAYYHGYINENSWFLCYPSEMFFSLIEDSIENLKTYFTEQIINPFEFVEDIIRR